MKPNSHSEDGHDSLQTRLARSQWVNPRGFRFWTVVIILLYTVTGFLLIPYLVKDGLIGFVENDLKRSAHIEKVTFNPYTLSFAIEGFQLTDMDEVTLLSFDNFLINFQLSSLFNRVWTFEEISLTAPYFYFQRYGVEDTRLSRLVVDAVTAGSGQAQPATSETSGLPRLLIHNLALSDGRGDIVDDVPETPVEVHIGPINITIAHLNTLPDQYGEQNVTIELPGNGSLHWEGNLALTPLGSKGQVRLTNAPLDKIVAYAKALLPLETVHLLLSSSFNYELHTRDDGGFVAELNHLDVTMDDVALRGLTPATDFFSAGSIALRGGSLRYPEQSIRFASLSVDEPDVKVWLNRDGSLNLASLVPPEAAEVSGANEAEVMATNTSEQPSNETATEQRAEETGQPSALPADDIVSAEGDQTADRGENPWQFGVDLVNLNNGAIQFADHSIEPGASFDLSALAFQMTDFSTAEGALLPLSLSGQLSAGGQFEVNGTVTVAPELALELSIHTQGIPLAVGQPYIQQSVRLLIDGGSLNSDCNIIIPARQSLKINGSVQIPDLDIKDTITGNPLLAWKNLAINRFELDMGTNQLDISAMDFNRLYARFAIHADQSTNISDLLIEADAVASTTPTDKAETVPTEAMAVILGGIRIKDGAVDFADQSLPLPFATRIHSVNGSISTISTRGSEPAKIKLEGQVNEYGLARIYGDISPTDLLNHTEVALEFRNLDMSRMSPYSGRFAGRKIRDGKLALDLNYDIKKGLLNAKNDITLTNLLLGEKIDSPNATNLPLDLAIALLKDNDGVINAKVPVSGVVNDPEFKLGGVIWEAIVDIITRAVTAPFRLLGRIVGFDSEDFGQFQFLPGRADLTPPELEKIVQLEEALLKRPQLAIEISGATDPEIDVPALQFSALRDMVIERLGADFSFANKEIMLDDEIRDTLETLFREKFPQVALKGLKAKHTVAPVDDSTATPKLDELAYSADLRDQLLAAQVVSDQQLTTLAEARAEIIRAAFLASGKIAPARIRMVEPKQVESENSKWVTLELGVAL